MNSPGQISMPLMVCALVVTLGLMVVPLPTWAAMARPAIYPATLLFWILADPRRVGVIVAWLGGFPLDLVYNTVLGQHGLALAVAAFAVLKLRDLLMLCPVWQQGVILLPVFAVYEFVLFWIDGVTGRDVAMLWRWLPVFSTALVWPFLSLVLERFAASKVHR